MSRQGAFPHPGSKTGTETPGSCTSFGLILAKAIPKRNYLLICIGNSSVISRGTSGRSALSLAQVVDGQHLAHSGCLVGQFFAGGRALLTGGGICLYHLGYLCDGLFNLCYCSRPLIGGFCNTIDDMFTLLNHFCNFFHCLGGFIRNLGTGIYLIDGILNQRRRLSCRL